MLGKIIKHEFKATYQGYLLLFGAFMAVTLFTKIMFSVPIENIIWNIMRNILMVVWAIMLGFLVMAAMIISVLRFYRTMVKDEGYLTHTIPVKKSHLIFGKYVAAFVWTVASIIVMLLSIFIFFITTEEMSGIVKAIGEFFNAIAEHPEMIGHLLLILLMSVVAISSSIFQFYASVALGQMFSGHRFAGAVVFYFIINYAMNILSVAAMYISPDFIERMDSAGHINDELAVVDELMIMMTVVCAVSFIICYAITNYRLSRKLNLE